MPQINQTAPDFTLLDADRTPHTLSDYRGRKVVLAFYPAAFTGVCNKEMCTFQDGLTRFEEANAVVLGISVDGPFANGAFAREIGVSFPLLSDWTRQVSEAWDVTFDDFAGIEGYTASDRAVFVVDEAGTITYAWVAPNLGTEPDYDAVITAVS